MSTTKQKKQLKVTEASASYLVEPQQARHSGESRNPATLVCLPSVAEINPRRFSTQPGDDELVSFIPMKAVEEETGRLDVSQMRPWRELKKGYTPFQEDDVIFAKITPCMENGKFALAKGLHNGRAAGSTEFHVFRPGPNLNAEYLLHFLFTPELRSNAKLKMQGAAGQLSVTTNFFADVEIPLPSLDEQRRVVAEIEKQFTRLEAGIGALRRVQAKLKRYRAAVLKAACEGRLVPTEAELARNEGRAYESADQLLARILIERRKKWNGRGKYKEPATPDTASLPPVPGGWTWATLDALAEVKGGITKDQKRKHSSPARLVPYLRVANVQRGYIDLTEIKEIEATEDEIQDLALKAGDVLFNEGGDRDKLGRGWVWSGELPECIHQNHVFRARLLDIRLHPKYVSWYANSFGQKFFFDEGKHTTNLASISMTKLKCLPVPIPPPAEQSRIIVEVERLLSVVDEQEAMVTANLQRATRLRQAVLQCAFSP